MKLSNLTKLAGILLLFLFASSCNKSREIVTPEDLALDINITDASFNGFTMTFDASEKVSSIQYAIIPTNGSKGAKAKFENGEIPDIHSIEYSENMPIEILRDSIGTYKIYARALSQDGVTGNTAEASAIASPAGITMEDYNIMAIDITAKVYDKEKYSGVAPLVLSKAVVAEWDKTIPEFFQMYIDTGDLVTYKDGESAVLELNGNPTYDYFIAIGLIDHNNEIVDYLEFTFTSPEIDESIPEAGPVSAEVTDITSNSAKLSFTMSENCHYYYQGILSMEYYQLLVDYTPENYESPDQYVFTNISMTTGSFRSADYSYTYDRLKPGTEYIVLAYPINENGIAGLGKPDKVQFKTL